MKQPHIIYLLSDQHNPEVMGCAGDQYVRTPNIDSIYAKGVGFDNCYCSSPLCVPSRSSILSGLLPSNNNVYNNMQILSSDKATFVHSLAVNGYDTVLCGRMHFVGDDQRHGFEKRFVGDITPSAIGADNEEEIYGEFKRSSGQNTTSLAKSGAGSSAVLVFDDDVTTSACEYIKNRSDDRPLFMTVGFYGPHCPYIAPKELYDYYFEKLPVLPEISEEYRSAIHPGIQQWYKNRNVEEVSVETVRRIRAAYYAMVEYMDSLVGKIITTISEHLDLENTIIIYGSDHGDNIGKHGLFWKTNFYEGSARVPLAFSCPAKFAQGFRVNPPISLLDLAPTILSLTNSTHLPKYDGMDISKNIISGTETDSDRIVFAECSDIKGDNPSAMLRWKEYKLIYYAGFETPQLFNLSNDIDEEHDLALNPDYKDVCNTLLKELFVRWNPAEAVSKLENSVAHFDLVKKWVDIMKPAPIEEWHGDAEKNNYLL